MTLLMTLTSGLLWLTAGKTRRDLSGSAYLQSLDPARAPERVPRDAARWGETTERTIGVGPSDGGSLPITSRAVS